jgi:hypothetical protein
MLAEISIIQSSKAAMKSVGWSGTLFADGVGEKKNPPITTIKERLFSIVHSKKKRKVPTEEEMEHLD